MARIGFDAKRAFLNDTGLGNYSRNLLEALHSFHPDEELVLYTPRRRARPDFPLVENGRSVRVVTPGRWYEKALPSVWRSLWIRDAIRREGLDVYHGLSHELPVGLDAVPVKKVVTIHDLIFLRYPAQYGVVDRHVYLRKFRHACQVADRVIAVSRQTESDLIEFFGVPRERIRVVYQTGDLRFADPVPAGAIAAVRAKYGLPAAFVLSVGSLIERKNVLSVVRALAALKASHDPFLVVVGRGASYERAVRNEVGKRGLADRVVFLGSVPQEDLPAIYRMATAFVYPSLFEGFGIPILEALRSGVPVITSRGSCFAETGGPGSLYVDPLRVDELAQALGRVLDDDALRAKMIAAGSEHVRLFDPRRVSDELMTVYRALVA